VRCPKAELTPYAVIIPRFGVFVKGFLHFIYDFFVNIFDFEEKKKKGLVGGGGEDVRWCEQNFLTFVRCAYFFVARQRNRRKKTCIGGSIPLCTPSGSCAFCTCGPKVVREAASVLSLGVERTPDRVGGACSRRCFGAIPWCGAHAEPRRAGLVSRRCFGVILSRGAVRTPNSVGEGLGPPVAPSFHYLPVEIPAVFAVLFEAAKAKSALG
jgi:hypothetical protein